MSDELNQNKLKKKENDQRYIAFSLRNEQYAIPLLQAKEFIGVTEPTPVPQSPDYFKGIINLRGQIISVIDLRIHLQLPKIEKKVRQSNEESIIILNLGSLHLGMIVDSINSVLDLSEDELDPPPTLDGSARDNYIVGVARKNNKLTLILDIESLLSIQDKTTIKQNSKIAS